MCPHITYCFAVWRAVIKTLLSAVLLSLVFRRLSRCYFPVVGVEIDDNDDGPRQCPNNRNHRRCRLLWMQAVSRRPEVTVTLRSSDVIPLTTTDRFGLLALTTTAARWWQASGQTQQQIKFSVRFCQPAAALQRLLLFIAISYRWSTPPPDGIWHC